MAEPSPDGGRPKVHLDLHLTWRRGSGAGPGDLPAVAFFRPPHLPGAVPAVRVALLLVVGGSLGTLARFGVSAWLPRPVLSTLVVNAVGSFALGLFLAGALASGRVGEDARLVVAVGFLGAFTTMSAYAFETVDLWQRGRVAWALAHALGNPALSIACAAAGVAVARAVT